LFVGVVEKPSAPCVNLIQTGKKIAAEIVGFRPKQSRLRTFQLNEYAVPIVRTLGQVEKVALVIGPECQLSERKTEVYSV
jgi:hypothetical protein